MSTRPLQNLPKGLLLDFLNTRKNNSEVTSEFPTLNSQLSRAEHTIDLMSFIWSFISLTNREMTRIVYLIVGGDNETFGK